MFTTNECRSLPLDPRLRGISGPVINANKFYLIKKGPMDGWIHNTGPQMYPILSNITVHGMDVVKEIMDESLAKMDTNEATKIREEADPSAKFAKFCDLCVKVAPFCDTVVKVARMLFVG